MTSELRHLVSFVSRNQDFSRRCPHLTDKLKVKEVRAPPRVTYTVDGGTWPSPQEELPTASDKALEGKSAEGAGLELFWDCTEVIKYMIALPLPLLDQTALQSLLPNVT